MGRVMIRVIKLSAVFYWKICHFKFVTMPCWNDEHNPKSQKIYLSMIRIIEVAIYYRIGIFELSCTYWQFLDQIAWYSLFSDCMHNFLISYNLVRFVGFHDINLSN